MSPVANPDILTDPVDTSATHWELREESEVGCDSKKEQPDDEDKKTLAVCDGCLSHGSELPAG